MLELAWEFVVSVSLELIQVEIDVSHSLQTFDTNGMDWFVVLSNLLDMSTDTVTFSWIFISSSSSTTHRIFSGFSW